MDGENTGHLERVKREGSLSPLSSGSKGKALKSRLVLPQCVLLLPINKTTS